MPLGFMTNKFQLLYCIVSEFPTVVSAGYSTLLDHAWRRDLFVQLWRERENLWREWKSENTGMVASRLPPLRGCVSWGKASPSKPSGEGEPSSEETLHWSSRGSTRSTASSRAAWAESEDLSRTELRCCLFQKCISPCPSVLTATSQRWYPYLCGCPRPWDSSRSWLRSNPAQKSPAFSQRPPSWWDCWSGAKGGWGVRRAWGWGLGHLTLMANRTFPARNGKLSGETAPRQEHHSSHSFCGFSPAASYKIDIQTSAK